jgi:hypothetical protein
MVDKAVREKSPRSPGKVVEHHVGYSIMSSHIVVALSLAQAPGSV